VIFHKEKAEGLKSRFRFNFIAIAIIILRQQD
jgi:hypothetical protein